MNDRTNSLNTNRLDTNNEIKYVVDSKMAK